MKPDYSNFLREIFALPPRAAAKRPTVAVTMKARPTAVVALKAEADALLKSQALVGLLKAARARFAELNTSLTSAVSTGSISAIEAAKSENELHMLGRLIAELEGNALPPGENAVNRTRHGQLV